MTAGGPGEALDRVEAFEAANPDMAVTCDGKRWIAAGRLGDGTQVRREAATLGELLDSLGAP